MTSSAARSAAHAASDTKTPQSPPPRRAYWRLRAVQSLGVGMFYVIVLVVFSLRVPDFLSSSNAQTVLDSAALLGIVAVGQTFAIISGGFDLSVGGVVPLGAVVYGHLCTTMPQAAALLITIGVGAGVGILNGLVVAQFKINPLIGTLAMLSIAGGAAYIVTNGQTIPLTSASAAVWGDRSALGLNNGTWAAIGLAVAAGLLLKFTVYGRSLYTVGGNREAAQLAGLRVVATSVSVYVFSGACAAFGGAIAASQLFAAAPNIGTDTTLNSIAAVILGGAALTGGVGTISGTALGVLLLGTISDGLGLLQVASFYQTVITGGVLLLAVGFSRLRELLTTNSLPG